LGQNVLFGPDLIHCRWLNTPETAATGGKSGGVGEQPTQGGVRKVPGERTAVTNLQGKTIRNMESQRRPNKN